MEIIVGGRSPDSKKERLQAKFLALADKIGDKLYNRKPIKKDDVISFFKRKKEQVTPKKKKTVNIFEFIKDFTKKKEKGQVKNKRLTGMIILTGIILIISITIIYIASIVVDWLLSIMEWWVLFALFVVITTPIILGLAFLMATSSNDEVYNLK
jgi:hypothetical protein